MSSIFVDGDATDPSSVKRETEDLMKVEALMCVVSAVLVAFLFREKPKHPPRYPMEVIQASGQKYKKCPSSNL